MRRTIRFDLLGLGALAAMAAVAALLWPRLPETMPIHWDLHGQPDRYASRTVAALTLPVVALGLWLLMAGVQWLTGKLEAPPAKKLEADWLLPRLRLFLMVYFLLLHALTLGSQVWPVLAGLMGMGLLAGGLFAGIGLIIVRAAGRTLEEARWLDRGADEEWLASRHEVTVRAGQDLVVLGGVLVLAGIWSAKLTLAILVAGSVFVAIRAIYRMARNGLLEI